MVFPVFLLGFNLASLCSLPTLLLLLTQLSLSAVSPPPPPVKPPAVLLSLTALETQREGRGRDQRDVCVCVYHVTLWCFGFTQQLSLCSHRFTHFTQRFTH